MAGRWRAPSRPRAPTSPVLLLTGWADAANPADVPRVEGIIKKPFDLKQLAAAVSQALAAASGPPIGPSCFVAPSSGRST